MTSHGRKNGDKPSHPIPLWNGVFEHYDRIGDALWEFAWCIDAVTVERDGMGLVLGGSPVKLAVIVKALKGRGKETVRRHLKKLVDGKYIRVRRTPYGQVIEVLNSKKFGIWKKEKLQNDDSHSQQKLQNGASLMVEKHIHEPEKPKFEPEKHQNDVSKEDAAVTQHKDAAVAATPSTANLTPWKVLGSDLPMGSPRFQKIFEHYFSTRNGNPLSEAMERAIQAANKLNIGVPPKFFEAKRIVERREAEELTASSVSAIPELEAEPWAN
jgi:hypothetical protein